MSDDDDFDASHFCKHPPRPPKLLSEFKGFTHQELRTCFAKGCKAARPAWDCVPRAHQKLMTEDGFNPRRMQVWKKGMHHWEEIAERAREPVTHESGEARCCGKKTDQKRTVEEINKRKANGRAGRHITKEEDAKRSKEDSSQTSSPESEISEKDANKKAKVGEEGNSEEVSWPEEDDDARSRRGCIKERLLNPLPRRGLKTTRAPTLTFKTLKICSAEKAETMTSKMLNTT